MENIINKIVSIENSAKRMIQDAQDGKDLVPSIVEKELLELRQKEFTQAKQQLELEKEKAKNEYLKTIAKAELSRDYDITRLKAAFEEKGEKWADKLFLECIKRCCQD